MMGGDDVQRRKDGTDPPPKRNQHKSEDLKPWGVLLFGLVGATVTTFAVGQLRRTVGWFYSQLSRSQSASKRSGSSFRTAFERDAWKRHNLRMQEEHEEEMLRVERIRRMQSVFNRERNKQKRSYESWRENGANSYHQQFQRDDWYWKTDASYQTGQSNNYKRTPQERASYPVLSHHYSVLGLDRSRMKPYSEAEIKTAFRCKAKQFHPDQNQNNKEFAEAKFKEVMTSYEAIKKERREETHEI